MTSERRPMVLGLEEHYSVCVSVKWKLTNWICIGKPGLVREIKVPVGSVKLVCINDRSSYRRICALNQRLRNSSTHPYFSIMLSFESLEFMTRISEDKCSITSPFGKNLCPRYLTVSHLVLVDVVN